MAWLRQHPLCAADGCSVVSIGWVLNRRNEQMAPYCGRHADAAVKRLQADEDAAR